MGYIILILCILNLCSPMDKLSIASVNINGFCSSQPYIHHIINRMSIVGISEHWLSGPELAKLDSLCSSHCVTSKCHRNLTNAPPSRGRGYGGVALIWQKDIAAYPIPIDCDRIIGIRVKLVRRDLCVFNIYLPCSQSDPHEMDIIFDKCNEILAEYNEICDVIFIGDFNMDFGKLGGPRGNGSPSTTANRFLELLYNDRYQLICYDMCNSAIGPKYTFNRDGIGRSWIDHIFGPISISNRIASCGVLEEHVLNVSDHLPVFIVLLLNGGDTQGNTNSKVYESPCNLYSKKVKWHRMPEEALQKYTTATDATFEKLHVDWSSRGEENVEYMANTIINELHKVVKDNLPTPKRSSRNAKPFWSKELTALFREKKTGIY